MKLTVTTMKHKLCPGKYLISATVKRPVNLAAPLQATGYVCYTRYVEQVCNLDDVKGTWFMYHKESDKTSNSGVGWDNHYPRLTDCLEKLGMDALRDRSLGPQ